MSDATPQRATAPLVTSFFSPPEPEPAPWSGADTLIVELARRAQAFRPDGLEPEGPAGAAFLAECRERLAAVTVPLVRHGRRLAWDYRRRLGIVGPAERADVTRLVALLAAECGFTVQPSDLPWGGYFGADPDAPCRGVYLPGGPVDVTRSLVEWIGAFLAPWPRPDYRPSAPEGADLSRLVEAIDTAAARGFADAWWDGPDVRYAADDPEARPLLATLGLDHFPTLEEALRLAARAIDAPEVQCAALTRPYLMRVHGVVLFLFPDPGPTPAQLAHSAAKSREAVARALAFRQELALTGEAQPADVWRLLALQGGRIKLRRGDVDGGRVTYLRDVPMCITLPQAPRDPEADAAELLLLLGFALCAGPDQGFDYEALDVAGTKEQLTRPVALAFADAFRGEGEPQC